MRNLRVSFSDTLFKLTMSYDGSGRRIFKTVMRKIAGAADWDTFDLASLNSTLS